MPKSQQHREEFTRWSNEFKALRSRNDPEGLRLFCSKPLPSRWEREAWEGLLGFRKRSCEAGEKGIEDLLFRVAAEKDLGLVIGRKKIPIKAIYHNMPLANQSKGQVLADAFCVLKEGKAWRPLMVEVKKDHQNPWYALVENLQQVRLARACPKHIKKFVEGRVGVVSLRGSWGLVLAPKSYYDSHKKEMSACAKMLDILKQSGNMRIAFGICDHLADGTIEIISSNWS